MGLQHVLAVGLITTGMSGCAFLDLLLGVPPFDPDATIPPFAMPSPGATFSTGRATIELENETLVLDQVLRAATTEELGTHVTWTNGGGWYLSYIGYPAMGAFPANGYLSLDRIFEDQHWVVNDPSRCVTTTDAAVTDGVVGTAVCRGLKWGDYFSTMAGLGFPQEIPGQNAFDAEITFEVR